MIGIYKIINKVNNKIYIGQSIDIQERWYGHLSDAFCSEEKWQANKRHEQTYFHKALRKYGKDAFVLEILEECLSEELNEKEKYWIKYYHSNDKNIGYNMTLGGDGYSCGSGENAPGAKLTQEQCNLIKNKLKERWTSAQIQELIPGVSAVTISDINYGKTWFDPQETYPISINNGHRTWDDKTALIIKNEYADGATITQLANKYQSSLQAISNLITGKSYTNLPVIPRKVEWKRVSKKRKFTDDEVIFYRRLAETKSMLSIFKEYNINCNYAAFRNMIKGVTYKDVGI